MNSIDESVFLIYLEAHHSKDIDMEWAKVRLKELGSDLDGGIELVLKLGNMVAEDWEYGLIGHGPAQDLIEVHGSDAIRKLARIANDAPGVRRILEHVTLSSTHPFYVDIVEAGKEIGVDLAEPTVLSSKITFGSDLPPGMEHGK